MPIGTSNGEHFDDEAQYILSRPPITLVGDVLSLPGTVRDTAGPTNKSADYAWGLKKDPSIEPMPIDTTKAWMANTAKQILNRR
jgi:hypothetical protein